MFVFNIDDAKIWPIALSALKGSCKTSSRTEGLFGHEPLDDLVGRDIRKCMEALQIRVTECAP